MIKGLLVSEILGQKELTPAFFDLSSEKQKQVEKEIDRKSDEIAGDLISELKKRGYLDSEPDDTVLDAVMREVMKRHGVGK